jgi:hypothetical protein
VDNSIGVKELQVVSGAFKKKDERLRFFFFFKKAFFGWGREDGGNSTLF